MLKDLKVSDMSADAPVGTTLAILERTSKSNVSSSGSYLLCDETRV
jgi:hypothetical protein